MARNYACMFSLSETLAPHYVNMVQAFNKGEDFVSPYHDIASLRKPHLELFVKKLSTFSSFLHEVPLAEDGSSPGYQNDFQILGPFVSVACV